MKPNGKDVIYIDIDDDITAIIEKVQNSAGKIVALVLPKRATVMQSVVNMKLLKRTAGDAKKNIVLITSESSLLPLAGNVGLHVAPSLQSKPEIPTAPNLSDTPVSVDESEATEVDPVADKARPVGELSSASAVVPSGEESIEIDNDEETDQEDAGDTSKKPNDKNKSDKKLSVPNFNKFRTRLLLAGAALLVLIVGWVFAAVVLPKATIVIKTNNVSVDTNLALAASVSAKTVDDKAMVVPGIQKEAKKTDTQKVAATGKKDMGEKASGTVSMTTQTNCTTTVSAVPAGTSVSSGNFTFVTQEAASFGPSGFSGGKCVFSSAPVGVIAASAGDQYNLSARQYSVAGFSAVTANGSAMTGGVSKVVTVVAQSDVDGVKQKIIEAASATAKQDLTNQLKTEGYYVLGDTFASGTPLVTASPNVGDEAGEVTVNVTVTYTMMGAKEDGIKQLLEIAINKQIDKDKQKILDNGLSKALVTVSDKNSTQAKFTIQTTALAGAQQDVNDIKKAVAGKKKGEVQSIILSRPGVKDVTVSYSPVWVYSTPKSTSKINITFQQSNGATNQ